MPVRYREKTFNICLMVTSSTLTACCGLRNKLLGIACHTVVFCDVTRFCFEHSDNRIPMGRGIGGRYQDAYIRELTDELRLYSVEEIKEINATTFFDVLNQVTGFYNRFIMRSIQPVNVFVCRDSRYPDCRCVDPDFEPVSPTARQAGTREKCVPLKHYDYFTGSEFSFVVTIWIVILALPVTVGIMWVLVSLRHLDLKTKISSQTPLPAGPNEFYATEWVGRNAYGLLNNRAVKIVMDDQRRKVKVVTLQGLVARMLDLRCRTNEKNDKHIAQVTLSCDKGYKMLLLAVPGEVDLILYFATMHERDIALDRMKNFFESKDWEICENVPKAENVLWKEARTIDMRKQVLAKFFQRVVSDVSGKSTDKDDDNLTELEQDALNTKLTRTEFADALGLQPHSLFVRNMFLLVDSTGDGFVSFDEFKAYFGILCSGNADMKAEMFFKMFDTSRSGRLNRENYKKMIKSLVELNDSEDGNNVDINSIVDRIFQQMGKGQKGYLTMNEFKSIMFSDTADLWQSATLNLDVTTAIPRPVARARSVNHRAQSFVARYSRKTRMNRAQSMVSIPQVEVPAQSTSPPSTRYGLLLQRTARYVDNHRRAIFWVALYTLVTAGIFIERAHYYSLEREHAGLRRIAGFGVSVTRGAASAQMFTFASLLLTMCRNTLTFHRETFLNRFIPLDNMHDMHIYISGLAMFFTVMHVIGHLINFYHISTQASSDLNCYFREYFRPTHVLASFQYWTYETLTGFTGVLLVVVMVIMYAFAMPYARRNLFQYFSTTHSLYIVLYILLFLHGSARLVQDPLWGNFCIGPVVWFLLDKLISLSRKKVLLPVHKALLLPSGVINLVFKRPLTFDYYSGQWVRIACPLLGKHEYHPFTLTSSPHEDCLSLHIRAVGPWTKNLRNLFESNVDGARGYPKIYVDGPFGESHQDWYKFPVSVLVGAGIGITPFASILKDIAHRAQNLSRVPCQKVYFLWVTRTQRSFEWMTDIIRQVEATDDNNFVDVQICITQLKQKFDLRTTMLYICERHFQKIAGLSMFTGLRAKTHFGRPKFIEFFEALKMVHEHVPQIGVFSCGPAALTRNVNQACSENNAYTGPSLIHHYENF
ncbi:dual oxidase [Elysia marginata]|uniref:Dual oxidase n=1 Tax=Elysia marginata TaxID=1093978 RepID=A0AAV4F0W9_9GAST|nr:dual oxidase [Elysia marginata]